MKTSYDVRGSETCAAPIAPLHGPRVGAVRGRTAELKLLIYIPPRAPDRKLNRPLLSYAPQKSPTSLGVARVLTSFAIVIPTRT